jgi:carboxylesterase type B
MWIHGGRFELSSAAAVGSETTALPGVIYQGTNLVKRSVDMGQPVVFISANYRLNFFGTLASQEITDAGVTNLFLKDQNVAFELVQKYISQFGGDPDKVTVFGESAGAMSISTQMVLNNGNVDGKFRAAWIFSGPVSTYCCYPFWRSLFLLTHSIRHRDCATITTFNTFLMV